LAAWDLQRGSGGRFRLGLGTQVRAHVERRFSAAFDRPAERVKDCIRCIRAIWDTFQTGAKPAYKSEFYQFTLINPFFNGGPIEHPHIPIYLAGVNPAMCRAAGEAADGFAVHPFHSVGYLKDVIRPQLDEGARLSGKRVDALDLYAPVFAVSGDTQAQVDQAAEEVRRQIAFYASTPNYRHVLEYHGHDGLGEELSVLARKGAWEEMPKRISDEMLTWFAVIAPPSGLAAALRTRYEGLLGRVSLYFPISAEDSDARWREFTGQFRSAA
jgi:probable F420-dependent oxidoreductase